MYCVYSPLLQCLLSMLSVPPQTPQSEHHEVRGASHITSHLSFLNATLCQTVLLGQMDSLGRKSQHTFLIHLAGHAYLQIFPIDHGMIPTRNSPKGQPAFLEFAPIWKSSLIIITNHLCGAAAAYRG